MAKVSAEGPNDLQRCSREAAERWDLDWILVIFAIGVIVIFNKFKLVFFLGVRYSCFCYACRAAVHGN